MKKLVVATLAAAMMGGVFAENCSDAVTGCLVYDLKVTLKTLGVQKLKCKATCGDGEVYYFDTVTRKLNGYAWSCDYDCMCDASGKTELNVALWEPKAKLGWWLYDAATGDTDIKWDVLTALRYGKKGSKAAWAVEAAGFTGTDNSVNCASSTYKVEGDLKLVGVGGSVAYNKGVGDCIIKSISGQVVGEVTPDVRCGKVKETKGDWCGDGNTECCADLAPAYYACVCWCNIDWCKAADSIANGEAYYVANDGTQKVPAAGTWSLKYNASLSKGKSSAANKIPKYAQK